MTNDWKTTKLSEVLVSVSRPEVIDPTKEYPLLGIRLDGGGPFHRETKLGSGIAAKTLFKVQTGDFIYSRLFAWRGAFGIIRSDLNGCYVSGEFPTFKPNPDKLDVKFLQFWFRLSMTISKVQAVCTGSTPLTRNRFKEEFFLPMEVSLPSLSEQRRIVARIEELAAKIEAARALRLQAAEEAEVLVNAKLRTSYISFVKRFGSMPLHEMIIEAGYGTSEKCDYERHEGSVPVLRIPNVASERITLGDLKFARLSQRDRERLLLAKGDILVVRTNGSLDLVGRTAVVDELPEPTAFASYMIRLRVDNARITPEYGQRMLRHLRTDGQLVDFARTTAGQYNVSLGRLRSARIPIPPPCEQLRIVAELDALQEKVDSVKRLQAGTAAELDALLPSILDKAFKREL